MLGRLLATPSPLAIIGGAKVSIRSPFFKSIEKVDILIIGGGWPIPFSLAQGFDIGNP